MIVFRCLGCSLSNLPIEVLRCPQCGVERFVAEYGTLAEPESYIEPTSQLAETESYNEPISQLREPESYNEPISQLAERESYNEPICQLAEPESCNEPISQLAERESYNEPISQAKNFCDASTEQIREAKFMSAGCSPNKHEKSDLMMKDISVSNEEHLDSFKITNVEAERDESSETINSTCQNTGLKQEQQLQICSNNIAIKNNAIQEIPNVYDQAYSFNAEDKDVCDSANPNFSATVSAHGEEPQNQINLSHQPQNERENKSSAEVASGVDELSQFRKENGGMDFAGCNKCLRQFFEGQLSFDGDSKPYKCEKCLCRFAKPWLLKRHLALHSVERPFNYGQCEHTCKTKSDLNQHILYRHTDFPNI